MKNKQVKNKKKFSISVLSAKGGVGKTMLVLSLIDCFGRDKFRVNALDCDVNAPNLAIWLGVARWDKKIPVKIFPLPNKYRNCMPLKIICGNKTIKIGNEKRGEVKIKQNFKPKAAPYKINLISGDIKKGKTGSGKVVEGVIAVGREYKSEIEIIDSAPGTGYPVLTPLVNSDYVIIVTEPSILGFTDAKKLFLIAKRYHKKVGIVVNKWNLNPGMGERIKKWALQDYLGGVDFEPEIEQSLSDKVPPVMTKGNAGKQLIDIYKSIIQKIN